jgi:hypothetical protein
MISEGGASTAFRLFAKPPPSIVVPGVFAVLSPSIMSFAARVSSQRRHRQGSCWLGGQSLFHPLGPLPPPLLPWTATAVPPGVVPSTDGSVHPGRVMLTPHHRLTWKSSPTHFRSQLRRSRHRVQLRAWPNKCAMKSRRALPSNRPLWQLRQPSLRSSSSSSRMGQRRTGCSMGELYCIGQFFPILQEMDSPGAGECGGAPNPRQVGASGSPSACLGAVHSATHPE